MENLDAIRAAKKCFTQLAGELSQDQVDWVLTQFATIQEVADAFGVHRTTVHSWTKGENKPNGRNKMAFNFLLNYLANDKNFSKSQ